MRGLKHKSIRKLLALGLCLCVCLGLCPAALAVDLTRTCKIGVSPGTEDPAVLADMQAAGVVVDLYRVGGLKANEGYDGYTIAAEGDYSALKVDKAKNADDWKALSQEAAYIAREKGGPVNHEPIELKSEVYLEPGLYLVVAYGKDVGEPWVETEVVSTERTETTASVPGEVLRIELNTIAQSQHYLYTFMPQLVAVPSKPENDEGVINTANPGDWIYELGVTLKYFRSRMPASFEIVKSLSGLSGSDPAIFVFHWYAYDLDGTPLRDDVVTLSFTGAGEKRVTIENIPDGAHVVVHEEDNRTYTLTGENNAGDQTTGPTTSAVRSSSRRRTAPAFSIATRSSTATI